MSTYYVEMVCQVQSPDGTIETNEVEAIFERVADELHAIAENPSVGVTLDTGILELNITVEASDPAESIAIADPIFRSALHAGGIETSGWSVDYLRSIAQRADLVDA